MANMQKSDIIGIITIIIFLGGLAAFFAFAPRTQRATVTQAIVEGSVIIQAQIRGESTVAAQITTKTISFVTIHELFGGGAPGAIIGISDPIAPVQDTEVVIRVTKALEQGSSYVALMVKDDGDGIYEPGVDLPIVSGGEVVKVIFDHNGPDL